MWSTRAWDGRVPAYHSGVGEERSIYTAQLLDFDNSLSMITRYVYISENCANRFLRFTHAGAGPPSWPGPSRDPVPRGFWPFPHPPTTQRAKLSKPPCTGIPNTENRNFKKPMSSQAPAAPAAPSFSLQEKAYLKFFFHAAKHPHASVTGVFLGRRRAAEGNEEIWDVVDAIPLCHNWTNLSPMAEVGLELVSGRSY